MTDAVAAPRIRVGSLVGFLALVELTSGILQGYYIPLVSDLTAYLGIRDGDFTWFEAAQLLVSAIAVPGLAKLGDMVGHKRILLVSTVLTALASWGLVLAGGFWWFLSAWALQGFYTVWLPLEIALIHDRTRRTGAPAARTRRAAGLLVVALEAGAIVGALGGGALFGILGGSVPATLAVPAVCVSLVFFAILFGVPESEPLPGRRLDLAGVGLLSLALVLVTSGLLVLRATGPSDLRVWVLVAVGLATLVPFGRHELGHPDPAIDLRTLARPAMWPVIVTAGLFGISVLGAQVPLSTYAGTDPSLGYGLGLSAGARSIVIGVYLLSLIAGALLFALLSRSIPPRLVLVGAAALVGLGYTLFLPFHRTVPEVLMDMALVGLGGGALVAALPAAAAAVAPRGQTGVAAGMTNTTKTIGGSIASGVFGVVLVAGVTGAGVRAAPFAGYVTVWVVCAVGGFLAAGLLLLVPRNAFRDGVDDVSSVHGR